MPGAKSKMGFTLSGMAITRAQANALRLATIENVSLIKSIPDEYFKRITNAVVRSAQAGGDMQMLRKAVAESGEITERRVDMITTDQANKANTALLKEEFEANGIKRFRWVWRNMSKTTENEREFHRDVLNGQEFDLDDPPVIQLSQNGLPEVRGFPGQLVNCHCEMEMVWDF